MRDTLLLGLLRALPLRSQRAFISDYSRTARGTNEEVVILRELIVRRKLFTERCSSNYSSLTAKDRKGNGAFPLPSSPGSVACLPPPHIVRVS
jgi:hypothetical protein